MNIVTLCMENYKDLALKFIPDWARYGHVTVYSDTYLPIANAEVVPILESQDSREAHWSLKIDAINDYRLKNEGPFAYIDADCAIIDYLDVSGADIIGTSSIYPTRLLNAGVIFFSGKNLDAFMHDWKAESERLKPTDKLYEQTALDNLFKAGFHNTSAIDGNVYNSNGDDISEWKERIKKHKPKIIHFKDGKWRDDNLVKELCRI